jgi:hypothetical protein
VADKKEELIPTNELFEHPEKFPLLVETTIHVEELDPGPRIDRMEFLYQGE